MDQLITVLQFTLFVLAVVGIGVAGVCWSATRDASYARSLDALSQGGTWERTTK